jgi:hypothetical protein
MNFVHSSRPKHGLAAFLFAYAPTLLFWPPSGSSFQSYFDELSLPGGFYPIRLDFRE